MGHPWTCISVGENHNDRLKQTPTIHSFFLRDSVAGPGFSKRGFLGVSRPLISGILKSWWTNIDITSWGWEIYSDGRNPILDQNGPVPIPAVPFFCLIMGVRVFCSKSKIKNLKRRSVIHGNLVPIRGAVSWQSVCEFQRVRFLFRDI